MLRGDSLGRILLGGSLQGNSLRGDSLLKEFTEEILGWKILKGTPRGRILWREDIL